MAVHRESWTDEKVEALKRMHAAGEPFSTIGLAIGMSRNASIGKARRLGLLRRQMGTAATRPVHEPKPKAPKPPREPRGEKPRGLLPAGGLPKDSEARRDVFCAIAGQANERFAATMAKVAGAGSDGVLFLERSQFACAMPLPGWDDLPVGEKRVCGRPVQHPTSYCPACVGIVYAPRGLREFKERSMGVAA